MHLFFFFYEKQILVKSMLESGTIWILNYIVEFFVQFFVTNLIGGNFSCQLDKILCIKQDSFCHIYQAGLNILEICH